MSLLLLASWLAAARAAEPEGLFATELGAGGVSRASQTGLAAILTAPAVLALTPRYDFNVGARLGSDGEQMLQGAAMDSTTGPVALGLLYARSTATPPLDPADLPGWTRPNQDLTSTRTRTLVGGGLSTALADNVVGLGISVVYLHEATTFGDDSGAINGSVSLAGSIQEKVILSATAQNLVPDSSDWTHREIGGGARFQPAPAVGMELDVVGDIDDLDAGVVPSYAAGIDALIEERVPLRAGFSWDGLSGTNRATAGAGIGKDTFFLEYGISLPLAQPKEGGAPTWHALCLRLSFS